MPTLNLESSPCSTVGEEILLELRMVEDISRCPPSPVYRPTSPPLDPYDEAERLMEAAAALQELESYNLVDAGSTPGPSEAIHLAISPIPPPTPDNENRIPPSEEEVHNVQKLARAILRYRQAHPILLNIIKEWTNHLMTAIRVMSRSGKPIHPIPITNEAFDDLSHLRFIPIFTNLMEPYMEDSDRSADTPLPTFLHHIPTPAEMAHASIQTEDMEEDTDHPGGQWMYFNPGNTSHYPLVFVGTDTRPHAAKYIRYLSVNDGIIHQGTEGKNKAIYGTPLHTHSYPTPNFHHPGVKDTDHTVFNPSSTSCLVINDTLYHLGDPRVIADVHTLCAQHNKLEGIKRQRLDLDSQECSAKKKMLDCERYLTHAAVCTHLQNHHLCTRPTSPPSSFLPRIHAAQGPPEDQWSDIEGEDSLEL